MVGWWAGGWLSWQPLQGRAAHREGVGGSPASSRLGPNQRPLPALKPGPANEGPTPTPSWERRPAPPPGPCRPAPCTPLPLPPTSSRAASRASISSPSLASGRSSTVTRCELARRYLRISGPAAGAAGAARAQRGRRRVSAAGLRAASAENEARRGGGGGGGGGRRRRRRPGRALHAPFLCGFAGAGQGLVRERKGRWVCRPCQFPFLWGTAPAEQKPR